MNTLFPECIETVPTSKAERLMPSYSFDQKEIIRSILSLHCPNGIDVDASYGNGAFYSPSFQPKIAIDIDPQSTGVIKAKSERMPLLNDCCGSVMFDPPFITYISGARNHNAVMAKRFGGYYAYSDLESHYRASLAEFYRVLKVGGVLIFKCQDVIHNHRMHATHVNVANWAESERFSIVDLFVLLSENRMPGPQKGVQRHARIHQSFFWVFRKNRITAKMGVNISPVTRQTR